MGTPRGRQKPVKFPLSSQRKIDREDRENFEQFLVRLAGYIKETGRVRGTPEHQRLRDERFSRKLDENPNAYRMTRADKKAVAEMERRRKALFNNPQLNLISSTLGKETWDELVEFIMYLPYEYNSLGGKFTKVRRRQFEIAKKIRDLADILEKECPERFQSKFKSDFHGLLSQYVIQPSWVETFRELGQRQTKVRSFKRIEKLFIDIFEFDTAQYFPALLRQYAKTIELQQYDQHYMLLFNFADGKLSAKEFIKRTVSHAMRVLWPHKRAPNKETALLVNLMLGLEGKTAVKPNDISQVNKKNRRRYHRDK